MIQAPGVRVKHRDRAFAGLQRRLLFTLEAQFQSFQHSYFGENGSSRARPASLVPETHRRAWSAKLQLQTSGWGVYSWLPGAKKEIPEKPVKESAGERHGSQDGCEPRARRGSNA
jgi:hypothetical protein